MRGEEKSRVIPEGSKTEVTGRTSSDGIWILNGSSTVLLRVGLPL